MSRGSGDRKVPRLIRYGAGLYATRTWFRVVGGDALFWFEDPAEVQGIGGGHDYGRRIGGRCASLPDGT